MAKNNDPLIESLMQLAVSAAPLIRKAREAGIFRERETVVDAEVVPPTAKPAPPEPPKPPEAAAAPVQSSPPAADSGQTAALQDIVVRQALRINELEAEVAAVKAAMAALAAATAAKAPTKAASKPRAKAKPAKA